VHLNGRQLGENVGHVLELRPVELDILPGAEMAVSAIPAAAISASVRNWREASRPYGIAILSIGA
jgi:hypothetical protein